MPSTFFPLSPSLFFNTGRCLLMLLQRLTSDINSSRLATNLSFSPSLATFLFSTHRRASALTSLKSSGLSSAVRPSLTFCIQIFSSAPPPPLSALYWSTSLLHQAKASKHPSASEIKSSKIPTPFASLDNSAHCSLQTLRTASCASNGLLSLMCPNTYSENLLCWSKCVINGFTSPSMKDLSLCCEPCKLLSECKSKPPLPVLASAPAPFRATGSTKPSSSAPVIEGSWSKLLVPICSDACSTNFDNLLASFFMPLRLSSC
mmetsp:Transcript_20663/g.38571  ORF Transcript_20663/g.38571 Transcript_20663/m.38571 type:complete len:261 (-) Transcript_20663:168-950(-)